MAIDELHVDIISTNPPSPGITISEFDLTPGGEPFLTFDTDSGTNYHVQTSTNLNQAWTNVATVAGTGALVTHTENAPAVVPRAYFRVATAAPAAGNLTNNQTLTINQTWSEEPGGFDRTALVRVPTTGSGPFPVVLLFHGSGGTSTGFIGALGSRLDNVIRVAPQGYGNQWNIDGEPNTDAPDVDYVRALIAQLKTYDNVDASNFSVYGSSNGSGMVNRLIIELDGADFQKAAGTVSQMITKMYSGGTFRADPLNDHSYNQVVVPATGRRILNINGEDDMTVFYTGGAGVGTTFLDSQESIFRLAQAMGYAGAQILDASGVAGNGVDLPTDFVRYTYLGGQVVHYKVLGVGHNLSPHGPTASDLVADFLLAP